MTIWGETERRRLKRDEVLARKSSSEAFGVADAFPKYPDVTDEEAMEFGACSPVSLIALFGSEYIQASRARELTDVEEALNTFEDLAKQQKLKIINPLSSSEFLALMRNEETVGALVATANDDRDHSADKFSGKYPPGSGHAMAILPFGSPDGEFGRSYMLIDIEKNSKKTVLTDYGVICLYSEASQKYSDTVYEDGGNQRAVFVLCKDELGV